MLSIAKSKPHGRLSATKTQPESTTQDGHIVRFTPNNGESYQVDVVRMYQKNLSNGNRRIIRRRGAKWFYDGSSHGASAKAKLSGVVKRQWCPYSNELQSVLESAFRDSVNAVDADSFNNMVHKKLQCPHGHPMIIDHRWNHLCNRCDSEGTQYRCSENCDYDICRQCSGDAMEETAEQLCMHDLEETRHAHRGRMTPAEALTRCKADLASSTLSSAACQTIRSLSEEHGLTFSAGDARHVALGMGSPAVLQVVLCSPPQVQMLGLEIFDRRYPGLVLNDTVKSCIRILLARGARLGHFAPSSKLLRKIEADALHAWGQRYLESMSLAGMELPEHVQHQVMKFLN